MTIRDIGVQARLMSQALRKISPSLTKSKCVLIFINQIRMKIGVMFGNPETTTGMSQEARVDEGEGGKRETGANIIPNLEIPFPKSMSNRASLNGGANLFLATFTLI